MFRSVIGTSQFPVVVGNELSSVFSEGFSGSGSLLSSLGSVGLVVNGSLGFGCSSFLVIGVQEVHLGFVSEGVSLLSVVELCVSLFGSDDTLDFIGVDEAGEVGIGEEGSFEDVAFLADGGGGLSAEEVVESLEGGFGPDDESAHVAAGGELEEVESVDVADFDAGDVSGGLGDESVFVGEDDQGALPAFVPSVSVLALAGSDLAGVSDFVEFGFEAESLEDGDEVAGAVDGEGVDDEGHFGHLVDSVSSGEHQRGHGGGGDGGGHGVSPLGQVDLPVPSSPGGGRVEHPSTSAHVTERSLAGSVGSGSSHSGNSGHRSSGTPGLGVVQHTRLLVDGVRLSSVLVQVVEHEVHDVTSDGGQEDVGDCDFTNDCVRVL